MKFTFLTTLFCVLSLSVWCQSNEFSIGKYDTLHSDILNEDRVILVHVPADARANNSLVRYPVVYLLDGEHHFTKTVGIIDHLSNTAGNELCPQMIVVAIFSNNRERDFIPSSSTNKDNADKFPLFLEKELFSYIDSHYATNPYRVFVGHSLGGLRVINTLVYQPQLFNTYIALDPSLGMVKSWITYANSDFSKNKYVNKSLYMAMGLTMPKGMDTATIFIDTSGAARHMRSIMRFAKNVQTANNDLNFNWKYYPDETHQSIAFKGTYDGLVANFNWFKNEKLYDIFKTEVTAEASVKIITDYYEFLSGKMGYTIIAPEQGTSELIDYLNYKNWFDKALAFAKFNYKNYPLSERTKTQLESAMWNTKKSVTLLLPQKTSKQIYKLIKNDILKKEPEYNISENALNSFGYELMHQNKLSDAEIIFKLNVELYPSSYNVFDSYGECLLKLGKEKESIAAYKKSLEINPQNTNASKMIAKYGITK